MKRFAVSTNSHNAPTIVAGKRYEVFDWEKPRPPSSLAFFDIATTDYAGDPFTANCIAYGGCAYLDGASWTIIEEEEPTDDN